MADRLDALLGAEAPVVGIDDVDGIRNDLERAARRAVQLVDGHAVEDMLPFRLPKARVIALGACERHALAVAREQVSDAPEESSVPVLAGRALDIFVAHELTTGAVADPVDDLLSWLDATGEVTVRDEVIAAEDRLELAQLAAAARDFAGIDAAWWPRTQTAAAVHLQAGAVRCEGRTDVEFGGPVAGRPGVVVEVKLGRPRPDHLAEVTHYSLLVALRDGRAPAVVARWYPGAGLAEMRVTVDVLRSAARRLADAIGAWAELQVGRPPLERSGPACGWCPDADRCPSSVAPADPYRSWVGPPLGAPPHRTGGVL